MRFDESIIARYPLPVRMAVYAVFALAMSGVLPMALAALQMHLADAYGPAAFCACLAADAAAGAWVVRHG